MLSGVTIAGSAGKRMTPPLPAGGWKGKDSANSDRAEAAAVYSTSRAKRKEGGTQ